MIHKKKRHDKAARMETVIAGREGREKFGHISKKGFHKAVPLGLQVVTPPPALCTDNGIMIAWAALERYQRGYRSPLSTDARARWPLSQVTLVTEEEAPIDAVLAKGVHQSYDASL